MTSKTYSAMTSRDLTKLRPQSVAVSKGDKWWPATEQPYTSRSRIGPLRVPLTQRLENQSCFPVWPWSLTQMSCLGTQEKMPLSTKKISLWSTQRFAVLWGWQSLPPSLQSCLLYLSQSWGTTTTPPQKAGLLTFFKVQERQRAALNIKLQTALH